MNLSGEEREELENALIDAFPNEGSLKQMLSFKLNKNLDEIASGANLSEIVFNLITTAESQGWIKQLISAACKSNPGNPKLQAICQELGVDADGVKQNNKNGIEDKKENYFNSWIVKKLQEFVIDFYWWALNPKFQRDYYHTLINSFQELERDGLPTGIPALNLEEVFVQLRVNQESLDNINPAIVPLNSNIERPKIWDFIAEIKNEEYFSYRRLAVIGPPGSGKTTLLKHVTLTYAKGEYQKYGCPEFIPILLYLRKIRNQILEEKPLALPELIETHIQSLLPRQFLTPSANWIKNQLEMGNFLVMLDGLDEVASELERQKVSQWVNQQMTDYFKTAFIVTSRPHGFKSAPVKQVGIMLEVLSFTRKQMEQFIDSWYFQNEIISSPEKKTSLVKAEAKNKAENLVERIISNRAIADMARNPLLVTMISTVHRNDNALPRKRVKLYDRIFDLLLKKRQKDKGIETLVTVEHKSILQILALALMQQKTRDFAPQEGEQLIKDELDKLEVNTLPASNFLEEIKNISGLLVETEVGVYEFAHLSFQEYLAATQIKELQQENILIDKIDDSWWAETIRLYAAQGDATNLISKAIENQTVNSLSLAVDCLEESLKVKPEVREKLEEILEEGLESSDSKIAKLVAEVKLSRRLNNLKKINENTEIDLSYITHAEYQLFVDEQLNSELHFPPGSSKKPITKISRENAFKFCNWLSLKTYFVKLVSDDIYYYRLPTANEIEDNLAKEYQQLTCWNIRVSSKQENGIRVIRAKIPSEYTKLVNYLAANQWEKASKETTKIILKAAKQYIEGELDSSLIEKIPSECLSRIDTFWMQYSTGNYSWGVRKNFENSPNSDNFPFCSFSTSGNIKEVFDALVQKYIACGIEGTSPLSSFGVVTVNRQGQEIQWQCCQAEYRSEDLGNNITLDMVAIPGGTFTMGAPENEKVSRDREHPQHQVTVQPFLMGKYPVTQAQWKAVAALPKVNRDLIPKPSSFKGDNLPVEQVSWYDAVEFCARLSNHTGREYRLPSEAEWEYACRAGTTTPFHFGETITGELANYRASKTYADEPEEKYRNETTPVGQFLPNAFGLYDMHGNIWEWCLDDWHNNYEGAPTDGSAWFNNDNDSLYHKSNLVVLRGGSWYNVPGYCRSAYRDFYPSRDDFYDLIGFRVVCAVGRTFR